MSSTKRAGLCMREEMYPSYSPAQLLHRSQSELEAGIGPMCQAARAGRLPISTRQPSAPTQVRVPASACLWCEGSECLVKKRQLFILRGASFPTCLTTREWRPLGVHNKEQSRNTKRTSRKWSFHTRSGNFGKNTAPLFLWL